MWWGITSGSYLGSDRHDCRSSYFKLACEVDLCRFDLSIPCPWCVLNTQLRFLCLQVCIARQVLKILIYHCVAYHRSDWAETKPRGGLGQTPSARGLSSQENPCVKFQRHPRTNKILFSVRCRVVCGHQQGSRLYEETSGEGIYV